LVLRDRTTIGEKNNKGAHVVRVHQVHRMHQMHRMHRMYRMQTTSENGRELSYCISIFYTQHSYVSVGQ